MKIFSGGSNLPLTEAICNRLGSPIGKIELKKFPSGEHWCQFQENIRGTDVFLVQSLASPVNDNLMELLLMSDAARRASAGRITAVIPYFGYARQDRKDKPRVPISARLVMDMIATAGFDRILTMDLHAPQIQGFTNLPLDHLSFKPALVETLRCTPRIDCVVAPDIGSVKRADEYATAIGSELVIISKKRKTSEDVEVKHFIGDVKGKRVLILDDLTESAGTIDEAVKACKENEAKEILVAITHGCFTWVADSRLVPLFMNGTLSRMYVSNTVNFKLSLEDIDPKAGGLYGHARGVPIPNQLDKVTTVDVSDLFAKAIKYIHNNESVSSLFK